LLTLDQAANDSFVRNPTCPSLQNQSWDQHVNIKMIPAPARSPTHSAIPTNPYEKLITLVDSNATKQNKTYLTSTIQKCLADLYKRAFLTVPLADPTETTSDTTIQADNATTTAATEPSIWDWGIGDYVFFGIFLSLVLACLLIIIAGCIGACCGAKGRRERRAREDAGFESGDIDAPDIQNEAAPARSSIWRSSKSSRGPGYFRLGGMSISRSWSRASRALDSDDTASRTTVPACQSGEFGGAEIAEGLPVPPPVYEMARWDPMYEEESGVGVAR
jgi:hypothetical protein